MSSDFHTPAKANGNGGLKPPSLHESPSMNYILNSLQKDMKSQKKDITDRIEQSKGEIISHVKEGVHEIRGDTAAIRTGTKSSNNRLLTVIKNQNKFSSQLEENNRLLQNIARHTSRLTNPSTYDVLRMQDDTVVTRGSQSASASEFSVKNIHVGKQPTVPMIELPSVDGESLDSTPERAKMMEKSKEQAERIAQLEKQVKDQDQTIKALEDSRAIAEATRNEQALKPCAKPLSTRSQASAEAHVQRAKEGREKKRKNRSALDKRLPPAYRDRDD